MQEFNKIFHYLLFCWWLCTRKMDIVWDFQRHLEYLDFSEDICLMSYSFIDMEIKLNESIGLYKEIKKPTYRFSLFIYLLGMYISIKAGVDDDVSNRLKRQDDNYKRKTDNLQYQMRHL